MPSILPLPLYYYIHHTFPEKGIFIDGRSCRNSKLHSFNDNPISLSDGTQEWLCHGKRHRDGDRPALICLNGTQAWYQHGKFHRDNDQPAI